MIDNRVVNEKRHDTSFQMNDGGKRGAIKATLIDKSVKWLDILKSHLAELNYLPWRGRLRLRGLISPKKFCRVLANGGIEENGRSFQCQILLLQLYLQLYC